MILLKRAYATLAAAVVLSSLSITASAQDGAKIQINPIYSCAAEPLDFSRVKEVELLQDTENASAILSQISKALFNTSDHQVKVAKGRNLKNAIATKDPFSGKNIIIYDVNFLVELEEDSKNFWTTRAILAHELAHTKLDHLSAARQNCNVRRNTCLEELSADELAGRALLRLGASQESVREVFEVLASGGGTHPPKDNRINAAMSGWRAESYKQANERQNLRRDPVGLKIDFSPINGVFPTAISYAHESPYAPRASYNTRTRGSLNGFIIFENHQHKALLSIEEEEAHFMESLNANNGIKLCLSSKPGATNLDLSCSFLSGCQIEHPKSFFDSCSDATASRGFGISLFSKAYADPILENVRDMPSGWHAPSLEVLKYDNEKTKGFTHFQITSEPLPYIQNATWVALGITANNYPVYFAGMEPKYNAVPYSPGEAIKLEFGLETLAFRGEHSGVEQLQADIYILDTKGSTLKTFTLQRDYTALRSAKTTVHSLEGKKAHWSGNFVHSRDDLEYTVTLASAHKSRLRYIDYEASYTTKQKLAYNNDQSRTLVAVVRPPLKDNTNYGIVAGLQDETEKIQFTFTKPDALQLCNWLSQTKSQPSLSGKLRYIRPNDLYLYEIGTGRIITCG